MNLIKNGCIYNLWPVKLMVPYFFHKRAEQEERHGRITRLWQDQLTLIDTEIILEEIKHDDEIIKLFPCSPIVLEIRRSDIFGEEVFYFV